MPGAQRHDNILRRSTFDLPDNLDPSALRCIQILIPDDNQHLAAFYGAISLLAKWTSWQRDDSNSGSIVAQTWKDAITRSDFMTTCEGETIRIHEWEDELSICESLRWNNGILEGLCCGEWVPIEGAEGGVVPSPDVTPAGTTRPGPGESKCYNVVLQGNGRWPLPFAVLPGDNITVSAISGSWHDGSLGSWRCPNGQVALFGSCTGGGQTHEGGDPDAIAYHMQLLADIGGTFASDFSAPIVVGGSGSQTLEFYANDGTPADNSGAISFRVCVENGAAVPGEPWCFVMDFTVSNYGFECFDNGTGICGGNWIPGQGWESVARGDDAATLIDVKLTGLPLTTYTYFRVEYTQVNPTGVGGRFFELYASGISALSDPLPGGDGDHDYDNVIADITADEIRIPIENDVASAGTNPAYLTYLELHGTGDNPFGVDNC